MNTTRLHAWETQLCEKPQVAVDLPGGASPLLGKLDDDHPLRHRGQGRREVGRLHFQERGRLRVDKVNITLTENCSKLILDPKVDPKKFELPKE